MSTTGNIPPPDFTTQGYKISTGQSGYDSLNSTITATDPVLYDNANYVIGIKDASTTDSGVITTGAQTLSGHKRVRQEFSVEDTATGTKYMKMGYDGANFEVTSNTTVQYYPPVVNKSQVTFQNYAPLCSTAPTLGNHLVNKTYADGLGGTNYWKQYHFVSSDLLNPNNSDWTVNALAPSIADPTNNAVVVRAFDDTTEEGVGQFIETPSSTTRLLFTVYFRMNTATSGNIILKIYARKVTRNGTIGSWTSYTTSAIAVPGTAGYWQRSAHQIDFTSFGTALVADELYQVEITRDAGNASDTATGDLYVGFIKMTFDDS